jgi:hypothetical protein
MAFVPSGSSAASAKLLDVVEVFVYVLPPSLL